MNVTTLRCLSLFAALTGLGLVSGDALARTAEPSREKQALRLKVRVEPAPDSATLARWLHQNSLRVQNQRLARVRALGLAPDAAAGQGAAAQSKTSAGTPQGTQAEQAAALRLLQHTKTQKQLRKGQPAEPKGSGAGPAVTDPKATGPNGASEGQHVGAARAGLPDKTSQGTPAEVTRKAQATPPAPRGVAARPDPMASLKEMLKAGRSGMESPAEKALRERLRLEQRRREQLKGGSGSGNGHQGGQGQSRGGGGK